MKRGLPMSEKCLAVVEINQDLCSRCHVCKSICPYEAIKADSTGEVQGILKAQGLKVDNYIALRLPCAGRVPTDFVFEALNSGVKNIVSVQCEDPFCRYKEGTKINTRRLVLARNVLKQLGFEDNTVSVVKFSRKAVYDVQACVGCDKCIFICPYGALEFESFGTH